MVHRLRDVPIPSEPIPWAARGRLTTRRALQAFLALCLAHGVCACDSGGDQGDDDWSWILSREATRCAAADAVPITGDKIYVSPQGDDANPGNRADAPLRTLGRALCNVSAGQTVLIAPGVYRESVLMGGFTADASPIVIRADTTGDGSVVFEGGGDLTFGLCLVESRGVVVEGLTFQGYTDAGLIAYFVHDLVIRANVFADNGRASINPENNGEGYGVAVSDGWNVTVEDNEAMGNGPNAQRMDNDTLGTGIDMYNLNDSVLRGNHGHDNIGGAMLVEDSVNVLVEGNLLENNFLHAITWDDGAVWVDGGHDVTLRSNTVRDNEGPGVLISDEGVQYPAASYGYVVEDNVITGNEYAFYFFNYGVCPYPPADAMSHSGNDTSGSTIDEIWCEEWSCGDHQPCD